MKFQYRQIETGVFRPVIPIKLFYKANKISFWALVDSGADFCLFNRNIAEELGIQFEQGDKLEAFGVIGKGVAAHFHEIELKVGTYSYKTKAVFAENLSEIRYGLVGQIGFFDEFIVKFDRSNQEIEVTRSKKRVRSLFWSSVSKKGNPNQ